MGFCFIAEVLRNKSAEEAIQKIDNNAEVEVRLEAEEDRQTAQDYDQEELGAREEARMKTGDMARMETEEEHRHTAKEEAKIKAEEVEVNRRYADIGLHDQPLKIRDVSATNLIDADLFGEGAVTCEADVVRRQG